MAIHPDVPGVDVEIVVDGTSLKEYDDPDTEDTPNSTTKYIEAESGKAFSIRLKIKSDYQHSNYDLSRRVTIDNFVADDTIYHAKKIQHPRGFERTLHGSRSFSNGKHIQRQMVFSELSIDDDDMRNISQEQKHKIDALGTIEVQLHRIIIIEGSKGTSTWSSGFKATEKVSEKVLKGRAVSHSVKLGEERIVPPRNNRRTRKVDEGPLVSYKFKYRSKEALQSLCILPRALTPLPLEERPVEELNPDEMREVIRRQKEREAKRIKEEKAVKREKTLKRERRSSLDSLLGDQGHGTDDDDVQIVEVRTNKRPRTGVPSNTDIIDLGD